MTEGTQCHGFFRETEPFRLKVLYWHVIPSCTELGFRSPGLPEPQSMISFAEGSRIQDQMVCAASAAEVVKSRSPGWVTCIKEPVPVRDFPR